MDLDKLKKGQDLTEYVELIISPINFISVADKTNSNYIDTNGFVGKNKIYGLLENILGLHFDKELREEIKMIIKGDVNYTSGHDGKYAYLPIIDDVVDIISIDNLDIKDTHIDYASALYSYTDSRHTKGSRRVGILGLASGLSIGSGNIDIKPYCYKRDSDDNFNSYLGASDKKKLEMSNLYKIIFGTYPAFYTSTTYRKYVSLNSDIKVKLKLTNHMSNLLKENIKINNSAYLGNSESIVNIKIN